MAVKGGSPEAREDFGRGSAEELVGRGAGDEDDEIRKVIGALAEGSRLDEGEEVGLFDGVGGGVGDLEAETWEVFVALEHAAGEARVDDDGAGSRSPDSVLDGREVHAPPSEPDGAARVEGQSARPSRAGSARALSRTLCVVLRG